MRATIPWARVTIEGAVIVVSILLAFGIDAWWEGAQARERERGYLIALRGEFTFARDQASSTARPHAIRSAEALIGQAQGGQRAPLDSLYWWLSGLSQQIEFDPPRAVFGDLISSGETQLLRSDSLRLALASYPASLNQLRHADEQAWATWEQRIQPLLEGSVPRVDRLLRGTFGQGGARQLPFGPSPHRTDWAAVLGDRNFESMLAERWMRLAIAQGRFDQTRLLIDEILLLIDRRLGSM